MSGGAPTGRPRRDDIEAAIAAYNTAEQMVALPPEAARLLTVMFPQGDVCQRSLASLVAEGFERRTARWLLQALIRTGFLSMEEKDARRTTNVYRLHLPPVPPVPSRRRP